MDFFADELKERIEPFFHENFDNFGELGAAVSIWHNGVSILELHGGFRDANREIPWTPDTLVLIWSATKGLASACVLHVLQENGIGLERRVAEFWPKFAQNGKSEITLAQLLSHQAGLNALDEPVDSRDYAAVISALERQTPQWPPGTANGYHARTFGWLLDELVRRLAQTTLGEYWRRVFAEPLALDLWIGLPEKENARVASVYAAKAGRPPEPPAFYQALGTPGSLVRRTFASPAGTLAVSEMNAPAIRALSLPASGGIGTASSLAKFYAMLACGGELESRRFFKAETIAQMTTALASGVDLVFQVPIAFSAGFMKDPPDVSHRIFGPSPLAFGHPGAGGSNAFADPENQLAFAYVMNQMEQSLLPNEKSRRLADELYRV